MDALPWAVLILTVAALGLLALVSPRHAREALHAALGLWIAATVVALPLLLARS